MIKQKNIIVIFNERAELSFSSIIKRYNLEENEEDDLKKLMEGKLSTLVIIKKIIRAFVGEIITKKDFDDSLQKVLHRDEQIVKIISKDIMENLVPLLDKVSEDKLQEYNRKKRLTERIEEEYPLEPSIQELLIEKIKQGIPDDKTITEDVPTVPVTKEVNPFMNSPPTGTSDTQGTGGIPNEVKKLEVKDVEENAEELQKQREETAKSGTFGGELQRKGQSDKCREATE